VAAGIVLPAQGERFNTETKTDPRVKKVIAFEALGQKFSCEMEIPVYIWDRLTSEDWDYAEKLIRDRAEDLTRQMLAAGSDGVNWQVCYHVNEFAKKAVYNQFMKYQARSGNHEGHEVPECLA
jgi:hypothetical protein